MALYALNGFNIKWFKFFTTYCICMEFDIDFHLNLNWQPSVSKLEAYTLYILLCENDKFTYCVKGF